MVGIALSGGGDMSGDGGAKVRIAELNEAEPIRPEVRVYGISSPGTGLVPLHRDSSWLFSTEVDLSGATLDIFPMTLTGGVDFSLDGVSDVAIGIPQYPLYAENEGLIRLFET